MLDVLDAVLWGRMATITAIDLMLAGDNALVVALAVRTLPTRQQLLGRLWGTAGAVVLRLVFIAFVSRLLDLPLVRLAGGLVLVWIALKLVAHVESDTSAGRNGRTLGHAIWIIVVADVSMSLDNVIAVAGAAHGDLVLVLFGIGLSIPLVVWGSGLIARLMSRHPWIVSIGGGIVGYVAGEMITGDAAVVRWIGDAAPASEYVVPIALALVVTTIGSGFARRPARRAPSS